MTLSQVPASLSEHWQTRPWLGRFEQFEPPLDIDEIAGLATDVDVESLLVTTETREGQTRYEIAHGPFDEGQLTELGPRDWTLLVRDIDRHLPALRTLWQHCDWIPEWRRADIMVSIAAPGGSVGAHRDSYDVFLAQGHGERQWQLAPSGNAQAIDNSPLRLVRCEHFTEHWHCVAGDVVYVPPGHVHHGVATTLCSTWSFGLQAPLLNDLFAMAGLTRPDQQDTALRLTDAGFPSPCLPGQIPDDAVSALASESGAASSLLDALGLLLSTPKSHFTPAPDNADELSESLHPWTNLFWCNADDALRVFCNGQIFTTELGSRSDLIDLCRTRRWKAASSPTLHHWLQGANAFA